MTDTNPTAEALTAARDKFLDYERQHRAKGTPDAEAKAVVNQRMATMMSGALNALATQPPPAAEVAELAAALRGPSAKQDGRWFSPNATYATKPRAMIEEAADMLERLSRPAPVEGGLRIGPRDRGQKTCKGCPAYESKYWREPSGDGETYDSGTEGTCTAAERHISAYAGDSPTPPEWCPALSPIDGGARDRGAGEALEPRGCPMPGACACPAPQSPNARAKIICEFMGWPEDGPAWADAHKLAASLSALEAPASIGRRPMRPVPPHPDRAKARERAASIINRSARIAVTFDSIGRWYERVINPEELADRILSLMDGVGGADTPK